MAPFLRETSLASGGKPITLSLFHYGEDRDILTGTDVTFRFMLPIHRASASTTLHGQDT